MKKYYLFAFLAAIASLVGTFVFFEGNPWSIVVWAFEVFVILKVLEFFEDGWLRNYHKERRSSLSDVQITEEDLGTINSQIVCIHCQKRGSVRINHSGFPFVKHCDNCGISDTKI